MGYISSSDEKIIDAKNKIDDSIHLLMEVVRYSEDEYTLDRIMSIESVIMTLMKAKREL